MVDENGHIVQILPDRVTALFVLGGFVLVILLAWLFLTEGGKKIPHRDKNPYDERQRLARFSAYRAAFWLLAVYAIVNANLTGFDIYWAEPLLQEIFGLYLAVQLFVTVCVWKDAWVSKSERRLGGSVEVGLVFWALNWVWDVVLYREHIVENGLLTQGGVSLIMLVTFIFPVGAYIIKRVRERRERDGE